MAETRGDAGKATDFFVETFGASYDKVVERLIKDCDRLPGFHDFPAEHRKHIRTTKPIESTFATVRPENREDKELSQPQDVAMACKPILGAKRKWRQLDGSDRLAGSSKECCSRTGSSPNTPYDIVLTSSSPTSGHGSLRELRASLAIAAIDSRGIRQGR